MSRTEGASAQLIPGLLAKGLAVRIFLAFAFAYFFSALLRAVTATLAPVFGQELGLGAADLGLLAGAYFLGFSALQLPLGAALDRLGPRRVLLGLSSLAVVGCAAFAMGRTLEHLVAARILIGMGVAAGLMAPLTCYRALYAPQTQLRANSWMLMTGSLGMVASTLPVQALLPLWGWRGLFWAVAGCLVLAMLLVAWWVPSDERVRPPACMRSDEVSVPVGRFAGYGRVFVHPEFVRNVPVGFFVYGGMIAVQALWAGPWLTQVAKWTPQQAAGGLFSINLCMLLAFMAWGIVMPTLSRWGLGARTLISAGLPLSFAIMAWILLDPQPAGAARWAAWCVACTFISLSQPSVGQAFSADWAGRALSAFNLVIFSGVFCVQWGIGLAIDMFGKRGLDTAQSFRAAFGVYAVLCVLSYLWYLRSSASTVADRAPK